MKFDDHIEAKFSELEEIKRVTQVPNINRETGQFLYDLILERKPSHILEVGAANGYSTIWIGLASQSYGGKVTTIELSDVSVPQLQQNLNDVFLENVTIIHEDAKRVLRDWDQPIEFAFVDAMKREYERYFKYIESHLTDKGIVIADNVVSHKDKLKDFLDYVTMNEHYNSELNPIGAGLMIVTKKK